MAGREEEIVEEIRARVRGMGEALRGHTVVLFGSRAAGTARPRSDFDVGVLGAQPLPVQTFFALQDELEAIDTLYRIELVDLQAASERFRTEALRHAVMLYDGKV